MHLFKSIVGIHGTYILFRKSKFNVMKTVCVILMFISTLGVTLFLTSIHPWLCPVVFVELVSNLIVTNYLL